ncbi:hypothetical protein KSD_26080 [Ktedonobacter sp. SOSP1-85]|uniref:AraC family transcriptional regulator n=1 Tax=Ktedonobacter sp. SOSP1-85 TaxID=2778367 RepID=UPI001916AA18|nr:AraC family transcriptional regulator [Ktedonobacter sp. SOSP1-85]GHO74837.1 hypothetical protein KSD_26080 [Ktedonobacter sp. SOSP1-85]
MNNQQRHDGLHPLLRQPIVPYIREADFAVRKPWRVPARRLLDYLIIYIQEGECVVHVEGRDYQCKPGDFCLVQPGDLLALEGMTDTITPFAHMDIFYHPEREQSFPTRPGQIDISAFRHLLQPRLNACPGVYVPVRFVPVQPAAFRETLLKMVGLWQQRDVVSQLEAQIAASELVLMLLKEQHDLREERQHELQSLNWVTSFLSLHLAETVSVADMAQRAGLSPSRFSALFRQRFGTSPHQFLLHLRVQHAQDLLRNTTLSQSQIASYCGFADLQHFAKMFKKITGFTPGSIREQL